LQIKGVHMRELFAKDPKRGDRLAAETLGCTWITRKTAPPMRRSICYCSSPKKRNRARTDAMFGGEQINASEKTRRSAGRPADVEGTINPGRRQ
jgi:glucose-6-phosphate isomerase